MELTNKDRSQLQHRCVRAAMALIASELDQLLKTPSLRSWCSNATIQLLASTQEARKEKRITRGVVLYARQVAERASALTWEDALHPVVHA